MKKLIASLSLLTSLAILNPDTSAATWNNFFPNYRRNDFHLTLTNELQLNWWVEPINNYCVQNTDSVDWWPDPINTTAKISFNNCVPWWMFLLTDVDLSFLDEESIWKWVHIIAVSENWIEYDLWAIDAKKRAIPSTSEFIYVWNGSFTSVSTEWVYTLKLHYKSKTIIPAKKKGEKAMTKRNEIKIPLVNKKNALITIHCENIKAESFSACGYLAAWKEGNSGNTDSVAILINDTRLLSVDKPTLRIGIVDYEMHTHWSIRYFVIPTQLIKKSPKANLKIMSNGKIISELPTLEDVTQGLAEKSWQSKSITLSQNTKSIKSWVKYKIKPNTSSLITNENILVNGAKVEILSIDIEKWTYEFIMPQFSEWVKKVNIEFRYTASWSSNTIKIGSRDTDPKEKEVKDPTLQNLTAAKDGTISFIKPKNFTCNIVWIVFRAEKGKERWSNTQVDMIITEKVIDGELYIIATPQSAIPSTTQWTVKCQIFFNTWLTTNTVGSRIITLAKD